MMEMQELSNPFKEESDQYDTQVWEGDSNLGSTSTWRELGNAYKALSKMYLKITNIYKKKKNIKIKEENSHAQSDAFSKKQACFLMFDCNPDN